MYKATIRVTLRPSILDPQGKAVEHALDNLGYSSVQHVRIGKLVEMTIDAADESAAREVAEQSCSKLLANPVMEDYAISIEPS